MFKLLSRQDKSFGVIGSTTGGHKIITSLVWLTAEILVAGTSADQLLFIECGDPKQNFIASTVEMLDLEKAKETYIYTQFQFRYLFLYTLNLYVKNKLFIKMLQR